jgi:hypothetical protein
MVDFRPCGDALVVAWWQGSLPCLCFERGSWQAVVFYSRVLLSLNDDSYADLVRGNITDNIVKDLIAGLAMAFFRHIDAVFGDFYH